MTSRRRSLLRDHQPRAEGPSNRRPQIAKGGRGSVGGYHPFRVLFPVERVPDQEWRLSILAASVLKVRVEDVIGVKRQILEKNCGGIGNAASPTTSWTSSNNSATLLTSTVRAGIRKAGRDWKDLDGPPHISGDLYP